WPEAEKPISAFRLRNQTVLNFSIFSRFSCCKPIQTPKERSVWELGDLHFAEELTSRITRPQAIFHTGKESMVMRIFSSTLRPQQPPERGADAEHNDVADKLDHLTKKT